ncbi:MAG: hypothetical protein U0441_25350 [Polyangiaceae bacterium]
MAISTISNDTTLSSIKEEDNHTRASLSAHPLTAALAAPYATFISQTWEPVVSQERALEYALAFATARVLYADSVLNVLVHKLDSALLMLTGKDREALLYTRYFGDKRPFEVALGVLGPQLETMRGWIPDLMAPQQQPLLQAIGAEIQAAVADADSAVAAKLAADNAITAFRSTGPRAQLVSEYNALRKQTYGALGKMRHEHPELPSDFADSFFRHDMSRNLDRLSAEQLQAKIDAVTAQKNALEKKRDARLAQQKAEADAKAAVEQKQIAAALDAKKKQKAALDADIAKMEAQVANK